MGVGWIARALLYAGKGPVCRKDVGCFLAAYMTPEVPEQSAGHQQHSDYAELPSM